MLAFSRPPFCMAFSITVRRKQVMLRASDASVMPCAKIRNRILDQDIWYYAAADELGTIRKPVTLGTHPRKTSARKLERQWLASGTATRLTDDRSTICLSKCRQEIFRRRISSGSAEYRDRACIKVGPVGIVFVTFSLVPGPGLGS